MPETERERWNARYRARAASSFRVHPLVDEALRRGLPTGLVADLACGTSGSALYLAEKGCRVVAVDLAEAALGMLAAEVSRRGLGDLVGMVQADLASWRTPDGVFALVLCTGFWDAGVFSAAAEAVAPGGLIAWEAYTAGKRERWCLREGEPGSRLPSGFTVLEQRDVAGDRRQLIARNRTT
jgi:SAM-dependent methyltransferase